MVRITKNVARKYGGWSWDQITAGLREKGYTLKHFEQTFGFGSRTASQTRFKRHPAVDYKIAEVLGVPVWTIFPHRYDNRGSPIKGGRSSPIPTTLEHLEAVNRRADRRRNSDVVNALLELEPTRVDFSFHRPGYKGGMLRLERP